MDFLHVLPLQLQCGEALIAHLTYYWFFALVHPLVAFKLDPINKSLAAEPADVIPLPPAITWPDVVGL